MSAPHCGTSVVAQSAQTPRSARLKKLSGHGFAAPSGPLVVAPSVHVPLAVTRSIWPALTLSPVSVQSLADTNRVTGPARASPDPGAPASLPRGVWVVAEAVPASRPSSTTAAAVTPPRRPSLMADRPLARPRRWRG